MGQNEKFNENEWVVSTFCAIKNAENKHGWLNNMTRITTYQNEKAIKYFFVILTIKNLLEYEFWMGISNKD